MSVAEEASPRLGVKASCWALGVPRASFYRHRRRTRWGRRLPMAKPIRTHHRALPEPERQAVLDVFHEERFVDKPPAEVYATLLDEGRRLCSISTMYRILREKGEVRERRNQLRHPRYPVPRLVATAPNQVWTWDITKLPGPRKWTRFYLYVLLDLYSRYVVGWRVERAENAVLAEELIEEACLKQGVRPGDLTIHADRGSPMTSKTLAQKLIDLGVAKSHSRPRVSNDNAFSESQFKTFKYRPDFPRRFGSLEDSRLHCRRFFPWYNDEHYHSGICLLTPYQVHYGLAEQVLARRHQVLLDAYHQHPERFVNGPPQPLALPSAVWINEPEALTIVDQQAVVKLGAGSGVGNSVAPPTGPGEEFSIAASAVPSFSTAVSEEVTLLQ
jgi:putative transposase